jgi:hypothetical protein
MPEDVLDIKKIREQCGGWDETTGCVDSYADTCPFALDCKEAADKGEGDEDTVEEGDIPDA